MTDKLTPQQRSVNMARIKSRDMMPEMEVRRAVHGLGYRYRLHKRDLPGNPDLVFSSRRKAIFVHGCFWHQHDDPLCPDGSRRKPKSNTGYWNTKLVRNVERDKANERKLKENGWKVLIVWECETKFSGRLKKKINSFLKTS